MKTFSNGVCRSDYTPAQRRIANRLHAVMPNLSMVVEAAWERNRVVCVWFEDDVAVPHVTLAPPEELGFSALAPVQPGEAAACWVIGMQRGVLDKVRLRVGTCPTATGGEA